jgi:hypothetical protein
VHAGLTTADAALIDLKDEDLEKEFSELTDEVHSIAA